MGHSTTRTCLALSSINMKSLVLLLPALVACVASDTASIRGIVPDFLVPGQCPVVNEKALWAEQKPNHPKYGGRWFEVARSKNPFQLVKQCTKSDLTYNGAGFDHITSGLDQNGLPTRREGTTFEFTTGANRQTPHLSIQFEQPSSSCGPVPLPWRLSTLTGAWWLSGKLDLMSTGSRRSHRDQTVTMKGRMDYSSNQLHYSALHVN